MKTTPKLWAFELNKNNPGITVLMSVYNGEKYLREAVDSILDQTYKNFEFLIINDGSTDSSRDIILSYKDPRIRLINNEANIGLSKSLNKGIKLAKSEYIARMDADDISLPKRLEKQLDFMEQNPEVGVCGCWYKKFGNLERIVKTPQKAGKIRLSLFFKNALAHSTVMMRKRLLITNELLYNASLEKAQDYFLWVKLSEISNCYNIPEMCLLYRVYPDQISTSSKKRQDANADQVRLYQLKEMRIKPTQSEWHIHKMMCEDNCHNIDLDLLGNWIERLILANRESSYFIDKEFSKILCEKYWHFCKSFNMSGAQKFTESRLSKVYDCPLKIRIKSIIYSKVPVKHLENKFGK